MTMPNLDTLENELFNQELVDKWISDLGPEDHCPIECLTFAWIRSRHLAKRFKEFPPESHPTLAAMELAARSKVRLTVSDLATFTGIPRASVDRWVKRLKHHGIVTKQLEPTTGRLLVAGTAKGARRWLEFRRALIATGGS